MDFSRLDNYSASEARDQTVIGIVLIVLGCLQVMFVAFFAAIFGVDVGDVLLLRDIVGVITALPAYLLIAAGLVFLIRGLVYLPLREYIARKRSKAKENLNK